MYSDLPLALVELYENLDGPENAYALGLISRHFLSPLPPGATPDIMASTIFLSTRRRYLETR